MKLLCKDCIHYLPEKYRWIDLLGKIRKGATCNKFSKRNIDLVYGEEKVKYAQCYTMRYQGFFSNVVKRVSILRRKKYFDIVKEHQKFLEDFKEECQSLIYWNRLLPDWSK